MTPSTKEYSQRLLTIGAILMDMARNQGRLADGELISCALEVIPDAQWVCSTYLIGRPIPEEPRDLNALWHTFRDGI